MKQLSISILLSLTYWTIYAQQKKPINATDDNEAYIEVTWEQPNCKIIRSELHNPSIKKTVNFGPEGLYGDGTATPGVWYIFELYEASGKLTMIGSDAGIRPLPPIATIEQVRYDADLYTSSPKVELADSVVIAQPEISGKWKSNRIADIKTVLRYIGGNKLNDVSVKVFISDDTLLDNTDALIGEITIEKGLNAEITELDESIKLPKRNYKNKNLILAVTQGQETKAITVKPL